MREREKTQKPVGGAAKPRSKSTSSTKGASSKPSSSSTAPKKSSSSTRTSAAKASSSSSSSRTSPPKASSSSSTSRTSAAKASSSSSSSKAPSSSTRTSKAATSSSSSKSRSTVELRPEKLPSNGTKPSGSREGRPDRTSSRKPPEPSKAGRTPIKRDDKTSNPVSREPSRGGRKPEKGPPVSRSEKSSSRSKGDRKSVPGGERTREDRSSRSQGRSKDAGNASKGDRREQVSSSRRGIVNEKSSSSSNNKEQRSRTKPSGEAPKERSSRKDDSKSKDRSKSRKEEKNKEERTRAENDTNERKSSRTREKSAKRSSSRKEEISREEIKEDRDSGIEGFGIQGSMIGQNSQRQEVEAVEHSQNSLETMESGISMSSPRDLSGDEGEVEESISSKMVEVDEVAEEGIQDEDEAMVDDDDGSQDAFNEGTYPSVSHYQNSLEPSSSLVSNHLLNDDGGGEDMEDDYDYEEDFEDYESDFEDDSGSGGDEDSEESSSESSASSSSSSSSDESDPNMTAVLRAMERENDFDNLLQRVYSFDDASQDERPLSPEEEERQDIMREIHAAKKASNQRPKTSRTFVNFAGAKKKQEAAHISSKMNSRGRALLSMIQLDTVSIDLLTMSPVSYEAYISSFGHSNRQQISVQTNEDALSEEIQTDEIEMRNKWTQKPVHISIGKDNQLPSPEDYLGVGGDTEPLTFSEFSDGKSSTARLTSFLNSSSQVMLAILEEELVWETAESNERSSPASTEGLGFSQPPVTLGSNVQTLLEGRSTPFVQFCPTEPSMLLSGHGFLSLGESEEGEFEDGGLLCVWWVQEPSRPQQLLSCCSSPTAASFSPARPSLILAGLEDGSLAAWDLREPLQLHTLTIDIDNVKWRVRVPSFVTACDEVGEGEGSSIVSIHTVTTDQDQDSEGQGSFQVVTLSANGRVTWWIVMHISLTSAIADISLGRKSATTNRENNNHSAVSPHLGASPWARIAIKRTATINVANTLFGDELLSSELTCYDLKLDINDPSQLYVATGSGAVAHCSRHTARIHPKAYLPEIESGSEALCISLCPHDYRYLLVGSSDGFVRLHSVSSDRPLTSWQSAPDCASIKGLQWSPARPCVFYVLDAMARLHIWDLSAGDIFPVMTVEAGGLVGGALCSFNIAPTQTTSRHPLYAVFASDEGEMVLRQVGPEYCTHQLQEDYETELERFTYYVNII